MMVLWMEEKKVGFAEKTVAIEAIEEIEAIVGIEAIERIALRGCGEGRGCLWYAISRRRFVLRLCGGGKMVVDGGFFGRMLKKGVKVWNFFVFFVILRD